MIENSEVYTECCYMDSTDCGHRLRELQFGFLIKQLFESHYTFIWECCTSLLEDTTLTAARTNNSR